MDPKQKNNNNAEEAAGGSQSQVNETPLNQVRAASCRALLDTPLM